MPGCAEPGATIHPAQTYGNRRDPDKTFIGKIARGFDLGYRFGPGILKLADTTIERFVATQLYEQGRQERIKAPLLGKYVRRGRDGQRAQ